MSNNVVPFGSGGNRVLSGNILDTLFEKAGVNKQRYMEALGSLDCIKGISEEIETVFSEFDIGALSPKMSIIKIIDTVNAGINSALKNKGIQIDSQGLLHIFQEKPTENTFGWGIGVIRNYQGIQGRFRYELLISLGGDVIISETNRLLEELKRFLEERGGDSTLLLANKGSKFRDLKNVLQRTIK